MALFRTIQYRFIRPTRSAIALGYRFNYLLWTKYFDVAWEATPLHEKLTWVMLLANTMAILTLFQILTLG